jgi:hypothetical protein
MIAALPGLLARLGYPHPPVTGSGQRGRAVERGWMALLWGLPALLLLLRCAAGAALPFVVQDAAAPWITAPRPVSAQLQQWGEAEAPVVTFVRRTELAGADEPARLHLRALGSLHARLDGAELASATASGRGPVEAWAELAPAPTSRTLELRVEVSNARGPALLSVSGSGAGGAFATSRPWSVRGADGALAVAVRADDTRRDPRSLAAGSPGAALAEKRDALLLLATLGGLAFLLGRGRLRPGALAVAAPLAASAAWVFLFASKAARIPPVVGFDARHHLEYVGILLERGALPLAAEGWSTYHPPLFYALSALVVGLGGGDAALKALPMLAGLGSVWVAWHLARRLLADTPAAPALAVLFAATLPVAVYSAAYFSNESLHALLAGAALAATADCLLAEGPAPRRMLLAALLFGLAALTKFTVLVTLPVAVFFLGWKLLIVERESAPRALAAVAAFAAGVLLVAGWFYLRNALHYGTPLVGNWALPGADQVWWQQPGFHTPAWYAAFGEALVHPFYSGFHSFWDGLYSTFWGDAFVAGRADPTQRHAFWDYGFMTAGYWLALPATALLLLGAVALLAQALGSGPPRRRLALLFLATAGWAVFLAFASLTAELPFFTQVKAAYLLMLAPPLALCFAAGFARAEAWLGRRGGLAARALLYAWLAAHAGSAFLAYAA